MPPSIPFLDWGQSRPHTPVCSWGHALAWKEEPRGLFFFMCEARRYTTVWELCSSHLFRGLLCWYARENGFQPPHLMFPAMVGISLAVVKFWCSFPSCPWKAQFLEVLMETKCYSSFQFLVSEKSIVLSLTGRICWKFVKPRRNK